VLDDDGDTQNTHSNRQVFQDIVPGTYTIVETPTSGFQLNAIDCTGATHTVDLPNGQVEITAAEGDAIVCTFTNVAVEVGGVTTGTGSSSALALTGSDSSWKLGAAIAALVSGAMLILVARRRRKGFEV
jgi:LPXTG-motif cell wall-anchored protein